jgi:iron-sulfur cluster assembly protein
MNNSVSLTENAATQISKQLASRGHGLGLRLGVKESGCTGYAYTLGFVDELGDDDSIHEQHGVKVVVSKKDEPFLAGIELDYSREGINEAFKFNNPNVKDMCGCGESFSV